MVKDLLGFQVKRDIYSRIGALLIAKNTMLTSDHLEQLDKHDIQLEEADVEKLENDKLITSAAAEIEDIFSVIKQSGNVPMEEMHGRILPSISIVAETPDLFSILADLQAKDDYTYRHNVGVAVFSNMIGKWLHLEQAELDDLTMAATFHDVGKIFISDDILNKPGRFTDEEFEQMKKHTLFGYDIIKNNPNMGERMALVAVQHHEREDGTGYPYGIKGDNMDPFSKIVAVADIFHALSTNRVYRNAMPFYKIMQIMREESFGKLNSHICRLFIQRMMELTVGNEVVLTDGRIGKVIMVNPVTPERPLVAVDGNYIDLSQTTSIHIETLSAVR